MIPYATFTYFLVLLYAAVPALFVGLFGRAFRSLIILTTFGMLAVQYSGTARLGPQNPVLEEVWIVGAFAVFQWVLARAFLAVQFAAGRSWYAGAAVGLALLPLIAVKLLPFAVPASVIGFLGISYVTFRALDVVLGIYDRAITSLPPMQYLAYLLFFPAVSAGPIDRYQRFSEDWERSRSRSEFVNDLSVTMHQVFTGFLYKFILAASVKQHWLDPAAADVSLVGTVSYMYAYSAYLFFDFAGYSAFAVGLSYLFGVRAPANFKRPFAAHNIREFWNRWHISLSWWLRDHVYMRFMLIAIKRRWFRSAPVASSAGLMLSFLLMGLWHGAEPRYLIYGLYHGALLVGYEAFSRWNRQRKLWGDGPLWRAAGTVLTVQVVCFGFLVFSGRLG